MTANEVKAQIKSNFKSMKFEDAVKANEPLLDEYVAHFGKRSYTSLFNFYKKHQEEEVQNKEVETPTEYVTEEATMIEVLGEVPEDITEEVVAEVAEESTPAEPILDIVEEDSKATFRFDKKAGLTNEEVEALLASDDPILKATCAIVITFEIKADFEIERVIKMYVGNDGYGWSDWAEPRAYLSFKDYKNENKKGSFNKSKYGFPIGEFYKRVYAEYIGVALKQFFLDRDDEKCKVEFVVVSKK